MGKKRACLAGMMAAAGVVGFYRVRLQPWIYTWGADSQESAAELPGDELVTQGTLRTTRAMTIDAPLSAVWPWLAQIGEDRGGFYSFSWLERAAGADIHNADSIHPEWQDLRVGDIVWLAKRYGDAAAQMVAAVEPESHLVLMSPDDFARVQQGRKASGFWGFYLQRSGQWTRLIVRSSGGFVGHAVFDLPHFVMELEMMRGIRRRAERAWRRGAKTGQSVLPTPTPAPAPMN